MTNMIERAAKELPDMRGLLDSDDLRRYAQNILLAALDEWDDKLVEAVARSMCAELGLHADDWMENLHGARIHVWEREAECARSAIAALKAHCAQGGTAP